MTAPMIYPPSMAGSASYAHLEDEVLHPPLEDRSRLASRLLESLDEDNGFELNPEWKDELNRRAKEIDEGTARMISSEEVSAKVRARVMEARPRPTISSRFTKNSAFDRSRRDHAACSCQPARCCRKTESGWGIEEALSETLQSCRFRPMKRNINRR
ncbi:MAG: addiction module protein [Akkermansiaceae bacterium]